MTRVALELTRAEALVLYEWLVRVDEAQKLPIEDPAEQTVLWRLEGRLESNLPELFASNYKELVAAARREVSDDTSPDS
jgi:hypothetical protein